MVVSIHCISGNAYNYVCRNVINYVMTFRILIKGFCFYVKTFDLNTLTGDSNRESYIIICITDRSKSGCLCVMFWCRM